MVGLGLNWWQSIITIFISQLISSVAMFFNSQCVGQAGFPITIGGGDSKATATGKSDARTTTVSVGVLAVAGAIAIMLS